VLLLLLLLLLLVVVVVVVVVLLLLVVVLLVRVLRESAFVCLWFRKACAARVLLRCARCSLHVARFMRHTLWCANAWAAFPLTPRCILPGVAAPPYDDGVVITPNLQYPRERFLVEVGSEEPHSGVPARVVHEAPGRDFPARFAACSCVCVRICVCGACGRWLYVCSGVEEGRCMCVVCSSALLPSTPAKRSHQAPQLCSALQPTVPLYSALLRLPLCAPLPPTPPHPRQSPGVPQGSTVHGGSGGGGGGGPAGVPTRRRGH
jgi:hypothetical protein